MRRWRKMTWVLVLWCAVIIVWAVANGTGLGVVLILLIGFIGFVFFALIWLMTRSRRRLCHACGENVKKGRTQCTKCGFDWAAAAPRAAAARRAAAH